MLVLVPGSRGAGGGLRHRGLDRLLAGEELLERDVGRQWLHQDVPQQEQQLRDLVPGVLPRRLRAPPLRALSTMASSWLEGYNTHQFSRVAKKKKMNSM